MLSVKLKNTVYQRASGLCEYCKSPAAFSPQPYAIEHIFPKIKGGSDKPDNLALSCQGCNNYKYNKTGGTDLITGDTAKLFNPRTCKWPQHF